MITAQEAMAAGKENPYSRWGGTDLSAENRFKSPIIVPQSDQTFTVAEGETFFAIGSCFARNVEERIEHEGATVLSRNINVPNMGTENARLGGACNKYTPHSILHTLEWASGEKEFDPNIFLPVSGSYYDPQLHYKSGTGTVEEMTARRTAVDKYMAQVFEADVVVITLGLIECWFDNETGVFLNGVPHPRALAKNKDRFSFHVMSYDECVDVLNRSYDVLKRHGKTNQKVIITVSPVPLVRTFTKDDVVVANTTSKNTLRAAVNAVVSEHEMMNYFPSYEAMTLSDPNIVWGGDRRHINDYAVGKVIAEFIRRYGPDWYTEPDDIEEEIDDSMDEKDILLADMARQVRRYKGMNIRLDTKLKKLQLASGIDSDAAE